MKAGWKTTEFWATALVVLSILVGWVAGKVNGELAVVAAAASSGLYAAGRGLAKGKPSDAQLADQVARILAGGGGAQNGVTIRNLPPGGGHGAVGGNGLHQPPHAPG